MKIEKLEFSQSFSVRIKKVYLIIKVCSTEKI